MIKSTLILLVLCITAIKCGGKDQGVETINSLNADGTFYFKSFQDGNFVEIHGSIVTENGESFLRMNGTYIFENYRVRFMVNKNEYKTEPLDQFA